MLTSIDLHHFVAGIDFVIGFFLLFGGNNVRVREGSEVAGLLLMALGLALFFSAYKITRGSKPRFRPVIYSSMVVALVALFVYEFVTTNIQARPLDLLGWAVVTIVLVLCIVTQRLLPVPQKSKNKFLR